jgi:hypothetical protein
MEPAKAGSLLLGQVFPFSAAVAVRAAERPVRVVCILGMHRSGTSCLTGSLQACGLELGQHSTWNPHNLQGNRENDDVVSLHETILRDNGGSWDRPPVRPRWSAEHKRQASSILARHQDMAIWGFKDPRALLLLEGWRELLGDSLFCIGIFRHPLAVAESLNGRGEFPRHTGEKLWWHYNRLLLGELRQRKWPTLCFDWPEAVFKRRVAAIAVELGLDSTHCGSFYREELHTHRREGSQGLALRNRYMYWQLMRIAERQHRHSSIGLAQEHKRAVNPGAYDEVSTSGRRKA